ncbi:MAG: HAMP domain-containing histidine kinase [Clostridiales bacterium]|nr:HAMP domain-containing histidine kinase [Clostridiales bacterium]
MVIKLKKYGRANITKIAVYAALIICVCLISSLLSEFIYAYNSDLEPVIKEQYYNSYNYYNEAGRALSASYDLLLFQENAGSPQGEYYYYVQNNESGWQRANYLLAEESGFTGYIYGWQHGQVFTGRLYDGATHPLPAGESDIVSFLAGRIGNYDADIVAASTVYVVFTDDLIARRQQAWEFARADLLNSAEWLLAVLLIIVPLLAYLALVTGRRPGDSALHAGNLDRLYSEILLLAFFAVTIGGCALWLTFVETIRAQIYDAATDIPVETRRLLGIASIIYVGFITWSALSLFSALIRKIKSGNIWKHSFTYKLLRLLAWPLFGLGRGLRSQSGKIGDWCGEAWELLFVGPDYGESDPAESLFRRQRRFLIVTAVLIVLLIMFLLLNMVALFLLTLLAEGIFTYYFLRDNQRDIYRVKQSVENSLAEKMKSEKLKVDLVTNVSHDLKNPLTSIISYVELLGKEELNPVARDYVQVLGEKSRRLDHIVSDLFDLAKATSGNIPLEIGLLDLKRLFEQTLADMEDRIQASGLELRLRLPEQPLLVLADGNKLYRALQNVLDNAMKYSLADSRIFVDLGEEYGRAVGTIKNTASYEMNFSAEDVLRRFSRGDAARSSEGSGLGLAIAKNFCECSGGHFHVSIDGDQFKVALDFPLTAG